MSDISKAWQLTAQLEARREFKFESKLCHLLRNDMIERGITMGDLAKASGLTTPQISDYRNDYKVLDMENAKKLAKGVSKLTQRDITPFDLIDWQKTGVMVDLVERNAKTQAFLDRIKGSVKHG